MAFIRNTDKLIEGSSKLFFSNVRAKAAVQSDLDSLASDILSEESARQSEDSGIKLRLDVIEGGAGISGSIAKAQADAQAYADQKVAALVNSAPEVLDTLKELSDAIGGDASFASTIAGQIGAVDAKVDQEVLDRQAAISSLQSSLNSDVSDLEAAIEAEESRAMLAEGALDGRLDLLEADPVTKSYVDGEISSVEGQVSAEQSRAEAAEGLLDGRLDVLEQDPTTKAYVDGEVSDLQGQITQEISDRQSAVSAEEARAMAAEGLLDGRLDVLEQDPTTKAYVDGEVSDLQGQITQEISDRQSAISSVEGMVEAEEARAMAAEGLLDGRLDVLEADPTTKAYVDGIQSALDGRLDVLESDPVTKTYVDGEVSDLQGQITQEISDRQAAISSVEGMVSDEETRAMAAESALDGRLDVLESDPVTKSYVDGEVSDLQGQVNTEKGRIDAILSAADADKDSFAEIVQLINSVDTTNDSAFAAYVLSNDAAVAQEVSDRQAGDSALDLRLDVLESDPVTKTYVDGLDSAMDSRMDALELDPVTKSYVDSANSAMDLRLDALELDPVSKTYVDGEVSDLQGQITQEISDRQSGDSALDLRLDALEADPVTKSYVDSGLNARLKLDGSTAMTGKLQLTNEGFGFPGAQVHDFSYDSASSSIRIRFNNSTKFTVATSGIGINGQQVMTAASGANILWSTDGAGNIGASGATRPNNVYVKTDVVAGGKVEAPVVSGGIASLSIQTAGTTRLSIGNSGIAAAVPLTMSAGYGIGRTTMNSNITLASASGLIAVTDTSAARTLTLPLAGACTNRHYIIKDESGAASSTNYIRIQPSSGQKVDGEDYYDIVVPYESVIIYSNGTNWFIV